MREKFADRVQEMFGGRSSRTTTKSMFASTAATASWASWSRSPHEIGHEVALVFSDHDRRRRRRPKAIAKTFAHFALHYPIPEWRGLISGIAFPLAPVAYRIAARSIASI